MSIVRTTLIVVRHGAREGPPHNSYIHLLEFVFSHAYAQITGLVMLATIGPLEPNDRLTLPLAKWALNKGRERESISPLCAPNTSFRQ